MSLKWLCDSCPPFASPYSNGTLQENVEGALRTCNHLVKQFNEFLSRQSCLFNYRKQSTSLHGVMPWHGYFVFSILVGQKDVATTLVDDVETLLVERLDDLPPW